MTTGNLTIQDNDTVDQYTSVGDSSFVFNFPILAANELKVSADQVLLTYGTDYSITGVGADGGGSITLLAGPSTPGVVYTLWQDMPIERLTGFSAGAAALLPEALNADFARAARVEQQLRREIRNSLRIPPDDSASGQDMVLPDRLLRAGKFLGFDASGLPVSLSGSGADAALRTDLATPAGLLVHEQAVDYVRTQAEITAGVVPVSRYRKPGDLRRYGAIADGATNAAAAWAAADAQAAAGGAPITVPRTLAGFAVATALTVDYRSDIYFEPGARLISTNAGNIVALTIGSTDPTVQIAFSRKYENLWIERQTLSTWASEACVGVRFLNITGCKISIAQINGFTINLQTLPAGGAGFQYNEVHLGQLYNGKIAVDLSNQTNGYTNENDFFGGRLTEFGGVNLALARYGIRITSSDGVYTENNNNHFHKPSIELFASGAAGEAVCVLMTHGVQNHFWGVRDEDNDLPFCREANASSENSYEIGYSSYATLPTIESTSTAPVYATRSARRRSFDIVRTVFASGPIHKRACYYDGGTTIHVPNVSLVDPGSATVFTNLDAITLNADYVDFGGGLRGPAIFVGTEIAKQFVVARDAVSGRGGRVVVNCYDAAGALITTAGSVKGSLPEVFVSSVNYGGAFTTGGDSNDDTFFTVTAAVKSVRIAVCGGTASVRLRSFTVYSVNAHAAPHCHPGFEEIAPGENIGTAAPTAGTWARGRRVWNATPAAAGTPGWVCTTAGTPGTWKAMAVVAA